MNKSPDAFRTISEVADDLDIPQHVLRFWETRFSPIRPLKRGGGRRYYRPDDVDLLKGIRQLLYGQGYTIKGVQRILKEDGPRFVQGIGRGETAALSMPPPDEPGGDDQAPETVDRPTVSSVDRSVSMSEQVRPGPTGDVTARPSSPAAFPDEGQERQRDAGLSSADVDRLRSALEELLDCERVLGTLRRG